MNKEIKRKRIALTSAARFDVFNRPE